MLVLLFVCMCQDAYCIDKCGVVFSFKLQNTAAAAVGGDFIADRRRRGTFQTISVRGCCKQIK